MTHDTSQKNYEDMQANCCISTNIQTILKLVKLMSVIIRNLINYLLSGKPRISSYMNTPLPLSQKCIYVVLIIFELCVDRDKRQYAPHQLIRRLTR